MRRLAAIGLVGLVLLAACGEDSGGGGDGVAGPGRWRHVRVDGVRGATGVAVLEGHLLLAAGSERSIFAVPFEANRTEDGTTLVSHPIPIIVDEETIVEGGEPFAAQGYRLGDLWGQPVAFSGIAAQAPGFVYLAERTYRVAYSGRLRQTPEREWSALQIDRVFVLPGADRSQSEASDWRDHGPGVAGLAAVLRSPRTEDLYALGRGGATDAAYRIHALDRYGLVLGAFDVDFGDGEGEVGGFLRAEKRFLVVRGEGRGLIHAVRRGRWKSTVRAARGIPGPEVEGADSWTGMAEGPVGEIVLVSGGETVYVAWRVP